MSVGVREHVLLPAGLLSTSLGAWIAVALRTLASAGVGTLVRPSACAGSFAFLFDCARAHSLTLHVYLRPHGTTCSATPITTALMAVECLESHTLRSRPASSQSVSAWKLFYIDARLQLESVDVALPFLSCSINQLVLEQCKAVAWWIPRLSNTQTVDWTTRILAAYEGSF